MRRRTIDACCCVHPELELTERSWVQNLISAYALRITKITNGLSYVQQWITTGRSVMALGCTYLAAKCTVGV